MKEKPVQLNATRTSIADVPVSTFKGKRVLIRVDYNVPIIDGKIIDDERIVKSLPTLRFLLNAEAKIIIGSHLGRPKFEDPELSLRLIAKKLTHLLDMPIQFVTESIIDSTVAQERSKSISNGEILLLENLRYYNEETKNDDKLAISLSKLCDYFVQDAFGCVHRAHSSTSGITKYVPSFSGLLVDKELSVLSGLMETAEKPFISIIGGSKVSSKIQILDKLLTKVDTLIIGGGMSFTFLKALGYSIGLSVYEETYLDKALELIKYAKANNKKIILPVDVVVADKFSNDATKKTVKIDSIPDNMMGLDIGEISTSMMANEIKNAKTVLWNGPMGVYEFSEFANGTNGIAHAMAECQGQTVIGGGDVVSACKQSGYIDKINYCSTGGGASLEFMQGKSLPGIEALSQSS